jgi:Zn-dependent alcohol dehydrogenase
LQRAQKANATHDMVAIGDITTNTIFALVIVATTRVVAIDYIATKHYVARTSQYCNVIASWE